MVWPLNSHFAMVVSILNVALKIYSRLQEPLHY